MKTKKGAKKNSEKSVGLTPKRLQFCHEYVKDLNGTQAAIRAGYAPRAAGVEGARLLINANVAAKVAELQREIAAKNEVTVKWLMDSFKEIHTKSFATEDYGSANKALENLGKMIGAFEKDNSQKSIKIRVGYGNKE